MLILLNSEISLLGINPIGRIGQMYADIVGTRVLIAALFMIANKKKRDNGSKCPS